MTTVVEEAMNVWGRKFMRDYGHEVDADAALTFEDDIEYSGYCETCAYEDYVVRVSDGYSTATYYGDMSDLLYEMNHPSD